MRDIPWPTIEFLNMLRRNWFESELTWKESEHCGGLIVSDNEECLLRPKEMELVMYTPDSCQTGEIPDCETLVAYARLDISNSI